MDKIVQIDLDNTLCDWDGSMIRDMLRVLPPDMCHLVDRWMNEDRRNRPEWVENLMSVVRTQAGWWRNLEPLELGMHLLDLVREKWKWEINILTKGPATKPAAWAEKVEWCAKHVGSVPVTICANKSLVYGRVLIDDYPPYMRQWLEHRPNGLGLMPAHSYNADFEHPNILRVKSIDDFGRVRNALDMAWERQDGEKLGDI
jgi:5'(3')-deoxyribonucleotidase